ncbi:MAG: thioredoxin domain-containing protein [Gemmatimonadaceae bacterium]|nr:thioredoxin domain-containing protein [Gemmatimonadaceae bacterium]
MLLLRTFCLAVAFTACSTPEPARSAASPAATAATTAASPASATDSATLLAKADRGRIQGDSAAKLWLVIVSDFQCPYCRQWHDEVFATVVRDYVATGKLRIAYVNLPLAMHANALPAAEAAMCTSVQGRFWQMDDALFRTQDQWEKLPDPKRIFDSLAVSVGVDPAAYRSCVESNAMRAMVEADARRVDDAGVRATPTFFLGDTRLEGAIPLPEFRAAIDKALAGTR